MDTTRSTLLIRIKNPRDTQAWAEFYDLYAPLLYQYARARGLSHDDAEDVRSSCYEAIVRQIPHFEYDKQRGGFKAWLRTIVHRRVVDWLRKRREPRTPDFELEQLRDDQPTVDQIWEQQWRQQHLQYCLLQVREEVTQQTYQIFRMLLEDDAEVAEVCAKLGVNPNQVYKAKARVLEMVRERMAALYSEIDG